eukprot:CAMPEP_0174828248 /NCGR_PEP_ID=MMETSP1114-20130205/1213_1 /TAXON_ID=312471 /ORGANISM="Neobodo designis, Strain CCAP 1951/1" /LENGTH=430 /DNA_ID=CAMNT_0016061961 /DNA_START=34 /DNA_END=1326 /DNA_ORIENTATION=-
MHALLKPSALVAAVAVLAAVAAAFPFSKASGVVELSPKTLPSFLNSHKPTFVMFYAPWCGHCKAMHPDYEKFAKSTKDVIRVGAINADQYREIGGQYGVQGFPTIKYWGMGDKKGKSPKDYQGQRNANALHNAAMREVSNAGVTTALSLDAIDKQLDKAESKKAVILFTSKNKSPPMFSVMAQSKHFKGKIGFVLVMEKTKDLASQFDVSDFPTIMVVSRDADGGYAKERYDGKIEYTGIAKFLQRALGVEAASDDAPAADEKKAKKPEAKKAPEADKPKERRLATPVRPLELTPENFQSFCAHGAPKVRGQAPFCVVSFRKENVPLDEIHATYSNEAVHFFWIPDAARSTWLQDFEDGLQPSHNRFAPEDVIVLRAAKDRTKFAVWRYIADEEHGHPKHFEPFLARCLGGDMSFDRQPGFPKLRDAPAS